MNHFDTFQREAKAALRVALQWFFLAVPTGLVCGLVGTLFHLSVECVTELRAAQPWLLFLLPALVIEMSFQPPYNHSHIMTYPLLKFQLMLHQESHVLLQSSACRSGYLPHDLQMPPESLHVRLFLPLYPHPSAGSSHPETEFS